MIETYGIKRIDTSDILEKTTKHAMCDYLFEKSIDGTFDPDDVDCASIFEMGEKDKYYNTVANYRMIFIPKDYMEEKVLCDGILNHLKSLDKSKVINHNQVIASEELYQDKLDEVGLKYNYAHMIHDTPCVTFLYCADVLISVCISEPRHLMSKVFVNLQYQCYTCGKIFEGDYKVADGHYPMDWSYVKGCVPTQYCCEDCTPSYQGPSSLIPIGAKSM